MTGIVDIEKHNKIVETLNAKKDAIKEAAKLGEETIESNKPKLVKSLSIGSTGIMPRCYEDKRYSDNSSIEVGGLTLSRHGQFGLVVAYPDNDNLIKLAACIIKAFGSIPQELIDSVEVK